MLINRLRAFLHMLLPYSLKFRLLIVLILSTLIPLALIGAISYYTIFSVQQNKVESGIKNSLNLLGIEFENCMNSLNYSSQQLAFEGDVIDSLQTLVSSQNNYQIADLTHDIRNKLNLISATNLQLGLIFYYSPDSENKIPFENLNVRPDFDFTKLPVISRQMKVTYFGPHKTLNKYNSNMVFSVLRQVSIPDREIFIYIETNYKLFDSMLKNEHYGINEIHFIANDEGKIIFSENSNEIPVGGLYENEDVMRSDSEKEYYIFKAGISSEYGWNIMAAVDKADFNHETYNWIKQFVFFSILSLCISVFFAWVIWKTIYIPIRVFNSEILLIENNDFDSPLKFARNKEFDHLFVRFKQMAINIKELIRDVEQKEKAKRYLEAEKLRYKINPHFLHNTLDTVRWLARMNGQGEIDRLVSSLNKVLHYNLGKTGEITTLAEELEILEEYVTVQKMKYDFNFNIGIQADGGTLQVPAPRFILQPLVENALQHCMKDDLFIHVAIFRREDGFIEIRISDNGKGISEETLQAMMGDDDGDGARDRIAGMGIGVRYVKSMIKAHYGEEGQFHVKSGPGTGTTVIIVIPDQVRTEGQGLS